jgi:hypothetical protein
MNVTVFHYETSTSLDYYDKDTYYNVHSVAVDLTQTVKILYFITDQNFPQQIEFRHPVYIEFSVV